MANGTDKSIIAAADFDTTQILTGIDQITGAIEGLIVQEDALKKKLAETTAMLNANKTAIQQNQQAVTNLDKSAADYDAQLASLNGRQQQLLTEQKQLQTAVKGTRTELGQVSQSAGQYQTALENVRNVARQVRQQGGNLFDIANINQQIARVNTLGGSLRNIFQGRVDTDALDQLEDRLAGTGDEFERLREIIEFIRPQLATLDPNSQEFRDLNEVVETGTTLLENFAEVQENSANRSQSLTGRLRQLKAAIAEMIDSGQTGTETFDRMQEEAAELQDAIDKTGERIRTFANDTRLIQGGIELLRGFAAGFELVEGTSALFGIRNEAVEESIKRLNAIMAVANGLQEVSNLLKKESVLRLVTEEIATKAVAVSQRILAATLGTTAAASRGLAVALAATGIGALVVGIGILISVISSWSDATKEQTQAQQNLNVAIEQGVKDNELFIEGILDAGRVLSAEAEVRQALAERAGETDEQQLRRRIRNQQELRNIEIKALQDALVQARAFEESRAQAGVDADLKLRAIAARQIVASEEQIEALQKTVEETDKAIAARIELEDALQLKLLQNERDAARARLELQKARLKNEEDFFKRLEELRKRLLDAQNRSARQDAAQLAKTAQDNLAFELRAIDREVRKGQLTSSQGRILKDLLRQINDVELTEELREFREKSLEAQQSIEDAIFDLRAQSATERANLLRDALEREAELIEVESAQQFARLQREQQEQLRSIRQAFDQGLISEERAEENARRVESIYSQMFINLTAQTRRRQEELANTAFERSLQLVQNLFAPSFVGLSESATREIQRLSQQFIRNRITYEQYQRQLTEITRRESQRRIELQITEANQLLEGTRARLALEQDPARREELERRIQQLREQIAQLQRQLAEGEVANQQEENAAFDARMARIVAYAQAIGNLATQVVGFWQRANDAEQQQLERSIRLQERRVEAATRIAERGNAEYLRLEEDRLNELQVRQENAARRQLAINAVLQTSQALVAFTTALAQGIATGGPLGGIAIATAVLGLIASGFAIVQSLRNQAPQELFEGSPYVRGDGYPEGRDTVPAMLTKGEAVLPTDINSAYSPTVAAMFDGSVPAENMNAFVNSYRTNTRSLPMLAHDRLGEAAAISASYEQQLLDATNKQNQRLQESTELLSKVHHAVRNLNISMNVDRRGIALSVAQAVEHEQKQKKV